MRDLSDVPQKLQKETETLAPAVVRAVRIMDVLAQNHGTPVGPSELARILEIPKSSIANICAALVACGMIRRVGTSFALGRKLAELGGSYLATMSKVQEFNELLPSFAVISEETVQLAVLDGLEVSYIGSHVGRQPVRLMPGGIGRRLPATCTAAGKAMLATLDVEALNRVLDRQQPLPVLTSHSHRTVDSLLNDLEQVRRNGYGVDNEETIDGIVCYAIAIPRPEPTDDIYAVAATLLKARATPGYTNDVVNDLRRLANRLSKPQPPYHGRS